MSFKNFLSWAIITKWLFGKKDRPAGQGGQDCRTWNDESSEYNHRRYIEEMDDELDAYEELDEFF